jgi:hypothetical protein
MTRNVLLRVKGLNLLNYVMPKCPLNIKVFKYVEWHTLLNPYVASI